MTNEKDEFDVEEIKKIKVMPFDEEKKTEWLTECPFCEKENIAVDNGKVIQIEEYCTHFSDFDWVEDTFSFKLKERD